MRGISVIRASAVRGIPVAGAAAVVIRASVVVVRSAVRGCAGTRGPGSGALKRRARHDARRQQKREQPKDTITIGGVELNDAEKSVTVDGEPVQLTPIEYNILHLLMRNPNRVFSSTQIYELVWNENAYGSESAVAVHIRHLREKIEINPSEPRYIKVVWGQGYKMEGKK